MDRFLAERLPAPTARLVGRTPDPGARRRLVEACRGELAWARDDWLRIAGQLGVAADPYDRRDDACLWEAARLPHELAAARLLNVWGHLHPLEHRLREAIARARAQRAAGWNATATLEDVAWYRRERRKLVQVFLEAAAEYRRRRAMVGSIGPAGGRLRRSARMVSTLWRKAS
ncbi:MAG: hypothetical protein JSS04_05775 [Proteobacteria bacterium]|nr:hypothetical protein [Pseudomonadota bacterium]